MRTITAFAGISSRPSLPESETESEQTGSSLLMMRPPRHSRICFIPFVLLLVTAFILSLVLPRFRITGRRETRASWYGGQFHGRPTASGRRYNMLDFSAAHCTLPLGSWLRVVNPENDRSVIVRITDRGPYKVSRSGRVIRPLVPHPRREVDLSYWSARKLGILGRGVTGVRVEYLTK